MKIKILTDSASEFTKEELKKYDVINLEMPLSIDGEEIKNETLDDFWKRLINGAVIKTSQIPQQCLMEGFLKSQKEGYYLIAIFISSSLSSTYNSAKLIKEEFSLSNVYVIDSLNATIGEKVLVKKACSLRDQNYSVEEIVSQLEDYKKRIRLYACIDTLKYLARGGRISPHLANIGNLVRIKPIITISSEGKVEILDKKIGLSMAMKTLFNLVEKDEIDLKEKIHPLYAYDITNAQNFINCLLNDKKEYQKDLEEYSCIGQVIGTHIGPGGFGIVYVIKN